MNRYALIRSLAIFLLIAFSPCHLLAASLKEKQAEIGYDCTASGDYSTAMGKSTKAYGDYSTAMGKNSVASVSGSTAMGFETTASALASTAMGHSTTASGIASTAMGYFTTASGYDSTVMGTLTTAAGDYSTAIGSGFSAGYQLVNDINFSFMVGYMNSKTDTIPEFFVKDGAVGINTTNPRHLLDLGNTLGRKLAVYQGPAGNSFYGFGISPDTLQIYAGADTDENAAIFVKNTTGFIGINKSAPGVRLDIAQGSGRVEEGYEWLTNSDVRLKKNISALDNSLDKISRIRGVRFDSTKEDSAQYGVGKHIGVIAQELEKEYPELVVGDEKTGYKAVAYDKLTAILIEAVKELKIQNEKQKAEIEELRLMINDLKG